MHNINWIILRKCGELLIWRISLSIHDKGDTKKGKQNDSTIEQIVSFDLPSISSVIATVSHRTTTRRAWCISKRSLELGRLARTARKREKKGYREIPARTQNPAVIRCGSVKKCPGIRARERRARRRSSRRNWSFRDFCRYSCVRFSRGIYWKGFLPPRYMYIHIYARPRRVEKWAPSRRSVVLARAIEPILVAFLRSPRRGCTRPAALNALSSSLIESPLYLRMPIEIYRRSRCSLRFNLLQCRLLFPFSCSPTSSNVISFSSPFLFFFSMPSGTSYFYHAVRTKMMCA